MAQTMIGTERMRASVMRVGMFKPSGPRAWGLIDRQAGIAKPGFSPSLHLRGKGSEGIGGCGPGRRMRCDRSVRLRRIFARELQRLRGSEIRRTTGTIVGH